MNKNERTQCLVACLWITNAVILTQEVTRGHFLFCSMLMGVHITLMEDMIVFFINVQHNKDYSSTRLSYNTKTNVVFMNTLYVLKCYKNV